MPIYPMNQGGSWNIQQQKSMAWKTFLQMNGRNCWIGNYFNLSGCVIKHIEHFMKSVTSLTLNVAKAIRISADILRCAFYDVNNKVLFAQLLPVEKQLLWSQIPRRRWTFPKILSLHQQKQRHIILWFIVQAICVLWYQEAQTRRSFWMLTQFEIKGTNIAVTEIAILYNCCLYGFPAK